MFLGKLHVMQQDRYSVWAQSTELGRVLYYDTPPILSSLSVLSWRLLTPRRTTTKSSLSEEVFFKVCVLRDVPFQYTVATSSPH